MQRRCSFEPDRLQEVLWYLSRVPDNVFEYPTENIDTLDRLISLYEASKFCSIRIVEYIQSLADACRLSKEHRTKLISIIELLLKQGTYEMVIIHDCFTSLPKYQNYVRYWYKEIIADIIESNMLSFLCMQFPNKLRDPITKEYRSLVANQVRNSNYGLC